jgi:hypothetical protein
MISIGIIQIIYIHVNKYDEDEYYLTWDWIFIERKGTTKYFKSPESIISRQGT